MGKRLVIEEKLLKIALNRSKPRKNCGRNEVYNPDTARCVSKHGATGRKIVEKEKLLKKSQKKAVSGTVDKLFKYFGL